MTRLLFLVLFSIWPGIAACCSLPARGITWSTDELIDRTLQIVLVDAVATSNGGFRLKIAEFLKGGPPLRTPSLQRISQRPPLPHTDFDSHTHPYFWSGESGRSHVWLPGTCLPSWGFLSGKRYLVFSDFHSLNHGKAAELIEPGFDLWLTYVRNRLASEVH